MHLNIHFARPVWIAFAVCAVTLLSTPVHAADASIPPNNEPSTLPLTTAEEAAAGMILPDGFRVSVFAKEPDVQQPIGIALDARGRMWVAENYTYSDSTENYDLKLKDRVVILEDTDHDGVADKRTVFWDQFQKLTSVEVGHGGVFVLALPHLLFIPDRNGDDVPDGPPEVLLDGWNQDAVRHNFVNGLRWGPDGWLYGRHGILATSQVGKPGCPNEDRIPVNVGIWRYHPTRQVVETVTYGTTNPWGTDWDEHGQMFFSNTVIGHLWHALPNAHVQRMYGEDLTPNLYQLIPQMADHFHWDHAGEKWSDIRNLGVTSSTDKFGGGHAHCGLMIYNGDNWPDQYRGKMFMLNLHGHRLNMDSLERQGATYVAGHEPDFIKIADPWFRAIDLLNGPDGGVYIADWTDVGECHENDGVHRTSGRIYKLTFGKPERPKVADVAQTQGQSLVDLLSHRNDWYARQVRNVLQTQAAAGVDQSNVKSLLTDLIKNTRTPVTKLRALWCLHAIGAADKEVLLRCCGDENEHVRTWGIKLLTDRGEVAEPIARLLVALADNEPSGLVLCYLASALPKLPAEQRWQLAQALAFHEEFKDDRVFPLMVWYGIQASIAQNPEAAVSLAGRTRIPLLRQFVTRRLISNIDKQPDAGYRLTRLLAAKSDSGFRKDVLVGMSQGLQGRHQVKAPETWAEVSAELSQDKSAEVQQLTREVSVIFGDGRALSEVFEIAKTDGPDFDVRRQALRTLIAAKADGIAPLLQSLLAHRELGVEAVRGLSAVHHADTAKLLLENFGGLNSQAKLEAVNTLAARPASAATLLAAVKAGQIDRQSVSPFLLRQMQTFANEGLSSEISALWPELKQLSVEKVQKIANWREKLTTDRLATANPGKGRTVWDQNCVKCHKLYGTGGTLGPDITGAQRTNLNYLLENILDPSATVAQNYRMTIAALVDGRVINGVKGDQTANTITFQTPSGPITVEHSEIEEQRDSALSLMPEGQLDILSEEQVVNLIGYLMSAEQVPAVE